MDIDSTVYGSLLTLLTPRDQNAGLFESVPEPLYSRLIMNIFLFLFPYFYVYENTAVDSPLRKFVVEECWGTEKKTYWVRHENFPHEMSLDLMTSFAVGKRKSAKDASEFYVQLVGGDDIANDADDDDDDGGGGGGGGGDCVDSDRDDGLRKHRKFLERYGKEQKLMEVD
jgi:hypothetical protein